MIAAFVGLYLLAALWSLILTATRPERMGPLEVAAVPLWPLAAVFFIGVGLFSLAGRVVRR